MAFCAASATLIFAAEQSKFGLIGLEVLHRAREVDCHNAEKLGSGEARLEYQRRDKINAGPAGLDKHDGTTG